MRQTRSAGTTLIELMVAVGFLGAGAIALLTCVNTALSRELYSQRRALILAATQNQMDVARSQASFGTISTGSSIKMAAAPGLEAPVTITTSIALMSGYTDLYLVEVIATWNEHPSPGQTRADSIILDTYIRTNDT